MSAKETIIDVIGGAEGMTTITRAVFDETFDGRFFAVGNPYYNDVWGTVGTFNEAYDELVRDTSCGNGGSGVDIIEVDKDGKPIGKPRPI